MTASNHPPSSGQNRWTFRHMRSSTITGAAPAVVSCLVPCLSLELRGDLLAASFPPDGTTWSNRAFLAACEAWLDSHASLRWGSVEVGDAVRMFQSSPERIYWEQYRISRRDLSNNEETNRRLETLSSSESLSLMRVWSSLLT